MIAHFIREYALALLPVGYAIFSPLVYLTARAVMHTEPPTEN